MGWTYLQMLLPEPELPAMEQLKQRWGDDLLWHLESPSAGGARLATASGPLDREPARVDAGLP